MVDLLLDEESLRENRFHCEKVELIKTKILGGVAAGRSVDVQVCRVGHPKFNPAGQSANSAVNNSLLLRQFFKRSCFVQT